MTTEFKIGDSVCIKDGVKDVDSGGDISGWCGRVFEVDKDVVGITWDSVTLKSIPGELISQWVKGGLNWQVYYAGRGEVELTEPRDTEKESQKAYKQLEALHLWDDFDGPDGEIIREVMLGLTHPDNVWKAMVAWEEYLAENFSFPFAARVEEPQHPRSPIRRGDNVEVIDIEDTDDMYGTIVELRVERRKYHIPLCDLKAIDKSSRNYTIALAYAVWYANR